MHCPYLSSASKKVCVRMLEAQMNGEVSDFDLKHFCDGNPVYCYYFRLPAIQEAMKNSEPQEETMPSITPDIEKKAWSRIKELVLKPNRSS